jgi:anti-anti-sigma factor
MSTEQPIEIVISSDEGESLTLILRGALDIYQADQLCEAALALMQHEADVVVSCRDVVQLDVAVLQILLVFQRELQSRGRELHLVDLSVELSDLLELAAVSDMLVA